MKESANEYGVGKWKWSEHAAGEAIQNVRVSKGWEKGELHTMHDKMRFIEVLNAAVVCWFWDEDDFQDYLGSIVIEGFGNFGYLYRRSDGSIVFRGTSVWTSGIKPSDMNVFAVSMIWISRGWEARKRGQIGNRP